MADYPDGHLTAMDELYVIEKVWPNTEVLATSTSEKTGEAHPVFWTNRYGEGPGLWDNLWPFQRNVSRRSILGSA